MLYRGKALGLSKTRFIITDGDFLLSQEAAAIMAGVSVQTMINWKKRENPPPFNAKDKTYPARAFGAWLSTHRSSKDTKGHVTPETTGFKAAETRLKTAQAIKAERDNALAEGLLIEIESARDVWQSILSRVRTRMLKLPTSLALVLSTKTDIHEIQDILKEGVHDALSEASEDWQNDEAEDGDDD